MGVERAVNHDDDLPTDLWAGICSSADKYNYVLARRSQVSWTPVDDFSTVLSQATALLEAATHMQPSARLLFQVVAALEVLLPDSTVRCRVRLQSVNRVSGLAVVSADRTTRHARLAEHSENMWFVG